MNLKLKFMKTVTMLDLSTNSETIIKELQKGIQMRITYNGKPVGYLLPIEENSYPEDDPIFDLPDHAEEMGALTNKEIDVLLYEK